jgi:transposase
MSGSAAAPAIPQTALQQSPGFQPPKRLKGSGRKRGGQPGHPGSGPELLPIERVDEVMEHHPDACRRCGTLLRGDDPDPVRHQVLEIPPITLTVLEHRLHRLVCPCCATTTCATLPPDVESSRYGPRLSGLVGLLGSAFPLSNSKSQALLKQLLGLTISRGTITTICQRLSASLAQPTAEALQAAREQPAAHVWSFSQLFLLGHCAYRLGVGIMGCLPPTAYLLREEAPLAAVDAEFSGVEASGFQYHRELVGSTPALWICFRSRHHPPPAIARSSSICRG